jgi:hypothetical protein
MVLKKMTKPQKLVEVETEWVNINDCVAFSKAFPKVGKYVKGYDRALDKITEIEKDFNPRLFGRPIVTKVNHTKYKYVIIDGNNRISALKLLHKKTGGLVEVEVIETKTTAEEVQAFLDVNLRLRRLSFKEQFRARLFMEEPEAVGIYLQLKKYGISVKGIDDVLTDKVLVSLWDYQNAYKRNPVACHKYIQTMNEAFEEYFDDDDQETYIFSSKNIRAGTSFFNNHPEAKVSRMVEKLKKMTRHATKEKNVRKYTPNKLHSLIEQWYSLDGQNGSTTYYKIYNEDMMGSDKLKYRGGQRKS